IPAPAEVTVTQVQDAGGSYFNDLIGSWDNRLAKSAIHLNFTRIVMVFALHFYIFERLFATIFIQDYEVLHFFY
ncbi:hypothetical protein PMAYCL1PPCAC_32766, partial [Pristionchus mayeri]